MATTTSFFNEPHRVGAAPSNQELAESINYLNVKVLESPNQKTWGNIVFKQPLSTEKLEQWIDECSCFVAWVSMKMYYIKEDGKGGGNNGSQITDFGLLDGTTSDRLAMIQSQHVEHIIFMQALSLSRAIEKHSAGQLKEGVWWSDIVTLESGEKPEVDPNMVAKLRQSQGYDNASYFYPEVSIITTYRELLAFQYNPHIAWSKPVSEKQAAFFLDAWKQQTVLRAATRKE